MDGGDFSYDVETQTYRHEIDLESAGTASIVVVEAIGAVGDRDVTDIPPLYATVDPDALDALLAPDRTGESVRVELVHDGFRVSLDASGTLALRETEP